MSNIDFGFQMLSQALSNIGRNQVQSAFGGMMNPLGQNQTDPGAVPSQNPGGQPDKLSPGSSASMMARAKQFQPYVQAAVAQYPDVRPEWLYGIGAQESGLGANIGHPSGAYGPFQFIGSTGRQYGLMTDADRADPAKSTMAAAAYMHDLLKRTNGNAQLAIRLYNGVGPGSDPNYVNSVGHYARMFSGFGGTGGSPSDAAVASGADGSTPPSAPLPPGVSPPPPLPPAPDTPLPPVDPQSPGSAAAGPQASAASRFPEAAGVVASADTGSATDVQPPAMPADDTPQLIDGLKRARANAGLPTQKARQVIQQLAGAQPRSPTGGSRAVPPPSAPSPSPAAGAAAAAGGPGAQRVTAGPGLSPAAGAAAAAGGPGAQRATAGPSPVPLPRVRPTDQERAAASPTGHPADAKPTPDDMAKAHAGDENNPPWPGKNGLNQQGYFPYQSVYGNKFTLPQLIYNIKKANPGISNWVLGGAVLLAQPMLRDAATEHVRDYQETMREYMETQREYAHSRDVEAQIAGRKDVADINADTKLKVVAATQAYIDRRQDKSLALRKDEFAERIKEFTAKDSETNQRLFNQQRFLDATLERVKQGKQRANLATLNSLLTQKKQNEALIEKAVDDKIKLAAAITPMTDEQKAQMTKDADALAAKAKAEIDDLEARIAKAQKGNGTTGP